MKEPRVKHTVFASESVPGGVSIWSEAALNAGRAKSYQAWTRDLAAAGFQPGDSAVLVRLEYLEELEGRRGRA